MRGSPARCVCALLLAAALLSTSLYADPVPVRYRQGAAHGFVALRTLDGKRIATGDMIQTVRGDRIISRLIFYFRDGSIDDETTVFTQRGVFHLVSDHHIQHGPSFPKPIDILIDTAAGQVTSHGEDGKVTQDQMDMPADLANGLPPNLLMNLDPSASETTLSFLAPTTKPRLIHVTVKPVGRVAFTIGDMRRHAVDYVLHVELGGLTGVIAPLLGKQPDDYHIWILPGASPAFIREEGQLYDGGPVWRIEQISASFDR
jgi:hypothetical protein